MNKAGITIKGGNVTRLGLLDKILNLTNELASSYNGEYRRCLSESEVIATTQVYKSVAETISSIDTNTQGIMVTNCNFSGMDLGIKVEQSPEENIKETTEEAIIEEESYEDEEDDEGNYCKEKCEDCEYYSEEDIQYL